MRVATFFGVLLAAAAVMAPIASAHHAVVSARLACDGTISYTLTSWSTGAQGTNDAVVLKDSLGNTFPSPPGVLDAADGYQFSGSFQISPNVTSDTLTPDALDQWGDGGAGGSYPAFAVTVTRPPDCASTATVTNVQQGGANVTSVAPGTSVTDKATVSGGSATPSGAATFMFFGNGTCSGTGTAAGSPTLVAGVASSSSSGPLNTAGGYSYQATYSGDATHDGSVGPCEPFSVMASPTISTTASAGVTVGGSVSDSATLAGTLILTGSGSITFSLYSASAGCSGTPLYTKTVNGVTGNGPYGSGSFIPVAAGTYNWIASFGGDANNKAVSDTCTSSNESVVVSSPPPPPPPPPSSPAISIAESPGAQTIASGTAASFTILVTNTGDVTLTNVGVTDALAPNCNQTSAGIAALGSMAPGASVSYNCSLSGATGSFTNLAVTTATPPAGPAVTASASAAVTVAAPPAIVVAKPAITISEDPKSQTVGAGGIATFTITVTNAGNVALTDAAVADPLSADCSRRLGTLDVGASKHFTCARAGVAAGFDNVATVAATPPSGAQVSAADHANVAVAAFTPPERPGITIVTTLKLQKLTTRIVVTKTHNGATKTLVTYGTAHFRINVTNKGNTMLTAVEVADALSQGCARRLGTLAAGASLSYSCTSASVPEKFTNLAIVTGNGPKGTSVKARSHAVVIVTIKTNRTSGA